MAQVSVGEIAEGSMSRMAEENKSEEKMARVSVLRQLFDRISSPPISELLGELKLDEGLLNTLKTNLQCLDEILDEAEWEAYEEEKKKRSRSYQPRRLFGCMLDGRVKCWLDDLKEVGYDLEDLLDKIAAERLRHQLESKPWNIETSLDSFNQIKELEVISDRTTLLLRRGEIGLGLSEASRILRKPYPLSAAEVDLEDESLVYGRAEDKDAVIELLLSDNKTDDRVTAISIVGEDGVGKTTLARLVYNDDMVSKQFNLKGWASLSPYLCFDEGLIKAFSEAFNIVDSRNIRVKLNEILNMKKFLLVLDDVRYSSFRRGSWNKILGYLLKGAKGSRILLTGRPKILRTGRPKILRTERPSRRSYRSKWVLPSYDLNPLNSKSSYMLFVKHAFADKEIGLHPGLEAIGKEIVTKCNGLPLLIVTLGAMLRFKPSGEEWEAVLTTLSDLDTKEGIDSILWMSYESLPRNLKRCFAYCSIFPNDHVYDKEKLVLLWMAEGFLQHSKHRRIEDVGHKYFDELTIRSFFQKSAANSSRFVMHSFMHNLARSASGKFCFSFIAPADELSGSVRHLSWSKVSGQKLISGNTRKLRTLLLYCLPPGKISTDLSASFLESPKYWQCLRVLSFSHHTITELLDSIGAFKLLQYLDLSHTKITRLPNTVTALYNLQTLLLSYCHLLSKLPKKFRRLVYLRHLDIRETCLTVMPAKMGCLTSLRSLSDFVVGKDSGSNIRELKSLKNLGGTLCISQLQNITSARDASEANLKDKADLKVLELKWSNATANSQLAANVLEKLEPHQNLEKLSIISYNGISFPDWVGDSSYSKMVFLHLSDCNSCSHLPPLGQLPSLKELIIERMRGLKEIGPEILGVDDVSANPFPSLEILVFREMPEWEGWIASEMQLLEFPRLKRVCIKNCPKCFHLSLCLPSLAKFEFEISVSGETSMLPTEETLPELPSIAEKQLHEGDEVQVRGKEKLQGRPSTVALLELENSHLPVSDFQRTDLSLTLHSGPARSLRRLAKDSSAKHGSASEDRFAATDSPSDKDIDDPINDEGNKLLDVPSTSRLPEELHLPDLNVAQPSDVPNTSNSPLQESPQHLTKDSSAKHGRASTNSLAAIDTSYDTDYNEDSQEDIPSPEQESMKVTQSSELDSLLSYDTDYNEDCQEDIPSPEQESMKVTQSSELESLYDTDYNEDSQEDIPSPEQESVNVSQSSELESLPPKLYSLEIEACDALESLPAHLNKLSNLQHLYIINCHLLKSIQVSQLPQALKSLYIRECKEVQFRPNAERHKSLENLCIESSCDSLKSFPLDIFPQLRSLSIWDCANFNSLSITEDHMSLDALEIKNCAQFRSFPAEELRIPSLTSILLSNCKNLKVLPGQLHGLTSLQSLFINACPEVESVPEGGLPSSLNLICISFCRKLTPCIKWGLHNLNDFSRIEIEGGSEDLESFPEQNLLPRNLISLRINRLPNLKVLDYKGLQHLTSLETLEINSCNKLHSLPDEGLPSSLSYLYISDCPLLNSELLNEGGKEWLKISHIPRIQIDGKVIS